MIALLFIVIITSAFISSLLKVNFKDLIFTEKLVKNDFEKLIENNFFTKYPDEKSIFEDVKIRIYDRVKFLKNIVESYFWIMNMFNIFIAGLTLHYLQLSLYVICLISICLFIALGFFRSYVFEKEQKEVN